MTRLFFILTAPLCLAHTAEPIAPTISADEPLQLSPLAKELAACGEDEAGIRARLELLATHLTQQAAIYQLHSLPVPDVRLIPISVEKGDGRHVGGAQWAANNHIVRLRMCFFTSALPTATDEASRIQREMHLNDTLMHELVHCCFYFRYPKLAKISEGEPLVICEGVAIAAARHFIHQHYFGSHPIPQGFYESQILSPRYARLYRAFCSRYLGPDHQIQWQKIDAAELQVAPAGYELRNRTQISGFPL